MRRTVQDAAKIAQISDRTIYDWIRRGRITVVYTLPKQKGAMVDILEIQQLIELRKRGRLKKVSRKLLTGPDSCDSL